MSKPAMQIAYNLVEEVKLLAKKRRAKSKASGNSNSFAMKLDIPDSI